MTGTLPRPIHRSATGTGNARILLAKVLAPLLAVALAGCSTGSASTPEGVAPVPGNPAVFQPGAPGEDSRRMTVADVGALIMPHTDADVDFMSGMIHHHAQAVEMVALMEGRTEDRAIRRLGLRIDISQKDEIAFMEAWLEAHGEDPSATAAGGMEHAGMEHAGMQHEMPMMPGMLSPQQMAELEAAGGQDFDRLFLEYMIQHHEGALVMVRDLFASPGAGQESAINRFASDVDADQSMEIRRMQAMLEARR